MSTHEHSCLSVTTHYWSLLVVGGAQPLFHLHQAFLFPQVYFIRVLAGLAKQQPPSSSTFQ
jgi:hypothetical protein